MRLNLSLLEEGVSPEMWELGREGLRNGSVQRLARRGGDAQGEGDGFDLRVQAGPRDPEHRVALGIDFSGGVAVLEEWDCSCQLWEGGCPHVVASALAVREALQRSGPDAERDASWRGVLLRGGGPATEERSSWICYDLTLREGNRGLSVSIVRRRRTVTDRGRRAVGVVLGWTPSAVGHFGYRTGDDPSANRDDLIPVLCSVNRHDLRVRTLQPGFVDVFLRLFVDADPYTLRVDGEEARVDGHERPVSIVIEDTPDGGLEVRATLQSHMPGATGEEHVIMPGPVPWLYLRRERCMVRPSTRSPVVLDLLGSGPLHVPSEEIDAFCRDALATLRAVAAVDERTNRLPPAVVADAIARIHLGEIDDAMSVELRFAYPAPEERIGVQAEETTGTQVFPMGQGPLVFARSGTGGRPMLCRRDDAFELRWQRRLCEAISGALPARLPLDMALDFLVQELPRLQAEGAEVHGREDLLRLRPSEHRVVPAVRVSSGVDWFGVAVELRAGAEVLRLADVIKVWRAGSRYVQLESGELARLPVAWLTRHVGALTDLQELGEPDGDGDAWRVEPFLLPALADLVAEDVRNDGRWLAFFDRLRAFDGIVRAPLPEGLQAELRGYQQHGYDWLAAIRELGLHGCLADDMGLGKTVQALAALLGEVESGRAAGPSIVVAPTSVVQNWVEEAARFTPSLRVVALSAEDRAGRRALLGRLQDVDLVVTSYALLRLDLEQLQAYRFHYAILDEAQAIKNPGSQTARAARALRARHRLTLTGTPLENSLLELWSQFQFLMPGFFGTRARFVRRYQTRAMRQGAPLLDVMEQLRARLRPFLLRRLKSDVDEELPPVTEVTLRCRMEPEQRELYEKVRNTYRARVLRLVDEVGMERSSLGVLEALLRLRQACCHPELLPLSEAGAATSSAKTRLFVKTVRQLVDEGRRMLVFSQWTTMLKILRREIEAMGITCAYMDGSTRDRQSVIRGFQDPAGQRVFLISLKAGGVGLNLTAADTVIHYDPWWNPAAEQQASDRAHRIGQTVPVLVLRMLVEDTVEEHILRLQESKRALASAAIEAEADGVKSLTRRDLELIFGGGAEPAGHRSDEPPSPRDEPGA